MTRFKTSFLMITSLIASQAAISFSAFADGGPSLPPVQQRLKQIDLEKSQLEDLKLQLNTAKLIRGGAIIATVAAAAVSILEVGLGELTPVRRNPGEKMGVGFNANENYAWAGGSAALGAAAITTIVIKEKDIAKYNQAIGKAEAGLDAAQAGLAVAASAQ